MSKGNFVLGTLAGLAIGAIAGVLFAPEKGSTTRKQIMDKGNDYVDDLKSKFDDMRDSMAQKFNSAKKDADSLLDKGKAKYYDAKSEIKSTAADFKNDGPSDMKHKTM